MKRFRILLLSVCIAALILALPVQFYAETGYTYDGITYVPLMDDTVKVFSYDDSKAELSFPDKAGNSFVTEIANYALQNDTDITSVDFSKASHLVKIGEMSFNGCSSLKGDLYLPARITSIGMGAFQSCSSLESVNYAAKSLTINEQCFNRCASLKSVKIGSGNKTIGKLAFANCPELKYVTIPNSVKSIDASSFKESSNVIIKCARDSYAHEYAVERGIDFELNVVYGDANGDGNVDIMDATYIQKYKIGAQGYDLTEYQRRCADVNRDGNVTVRDATLIQMKLAKYDVDF